MATLGPIFSEIGIAQRSLDDPVIELHFAVKQIGGKDKALNTLHGQLNHILQWLGSFAGLLIETKTYSHNTRIFNDGLVRAQRFFDELKIYMSDLTPLIQDLDDGREEAERQMHGFNEKAPMWSPNTTAPVPSRTYHVRSLVARAEWLSQELHNIWVVIKNASYER